jgi:hypothetical protein
LANSRKLQKHCVAGKDSDGNWIRLVNPGGSELALEDIINERGEQPKLLETWEIEVIRNEPLYYQPENWVIDSRYYWKKSEEPIGINFRKLRDRPWTLFGDEVDYLTKEDLQSNSIRQSLCLIYTDNVIFRKTRNINNRDQVRAIFYYNDNYYNLVVTDYEWEAKFIGPDARYSNYADYRYNAGLYLTIGLGAEFNEKHYKLVVGVIPSQDI